MTELFCLNLFPFQSIYAWHIRICSSTLMIRCGLSRRMPAIRSRNCTTSIVTTVFPFLPTLLYALPAAQPGAVGCIRARAADQGRTEPSALSLSARSCRCGRCRVGKSLYGRFLYADTYQEWTDAACARGARIPASTLQPVHPVQWFSGVAMPQDAFGRYRPLLQKVVLSDDIGVLKPRAAIFHFALSATQSQLGESLMIGDSWENDVAGAAGVGMHQVFYDVSGNSPLPFRPTYRITDLKDLLGIL